MKIKIKNALNTSGFQLPFLCETWIEYWERIKGWQLDPHKMNQCPACGKSFFKKNFDGCHVQKVGDASGKMYIIPLCDGCNHKKTPFDVEDSCLVSVP